MWHEIAAWQEALTQRPDLATKTITLYTQDARRFATWLQQEHPGLKATEVTPTDAKTYRDHLLAKRYAPTTINRALISLMLFFDMIEGTNPFRNLTMIDIVEPAPVALSKTEWNSVRRCAEQATRRDHGLAFALATLFRYAGPRVSEVAALQIPDVQIYGAGCSLFAEARDSNIARSRWSRKHANRSLLISNIANIWLNTGASGQGSREKQSLPGVAGQMGISSSVSADLWLNAAFVRSLPSSGRRQNWSRLLVHMICVIPLPSRSSIQQRMDLTGSLCRFQRFNTCLATLILRRRRSIPGSLLMILPA